MRAETDAAISAARLARRLADSRAGADAIVVKGGIDIVTGADIACEDAIRTALARRFPDYPVVGEERGGEPRGDTPYWLVDPICGTRCYASDIPLYCTNIALVEHGEVTVAAIGIGRSDEVLYAEKNGGAWLIADGATPGTEQSNPRATDSGTAADVFMLQTGQTARRIAASDASSVVWIHGHGAPFANFARTIWGAERWFVCAFPSTVSYAHLATGRIAGLVHISPGGTPREPPVHTAAGCLAVQEAGATITDADTGRSWTLETRSFVVGATPQLHRELATLVEKSR
jgi:fructose-1,6-bisphosphatase/inositol monophosphatase family enzyme